MLARAKFVRLYIFKVKYNHSSQLFCNLLRSSYRQHDWSFQATVVLGSLRRISDQFTRLLDESA